MRSEPTKRSYKFKAKIWKYRGRAAWHFVTIPKAISKTIRSNHQSSEEGWGRLKATAKLGATTWQTAVWFDTKHKAYLLPLKAVVRKKEGLSLGAEVSLTITFED